MGGIGGEVLQLVRVGFEVEELRFVGFAERELEAAVAQRDHRRDRALGGVFHRDRAALARAGGDADEALAVGPGRDVAEVDAGEFGQGGQDVERRDGRVDAAGAARPGAAIISGTRAEPSRKLILNQRPRSPSMSPWSERKTTIVFSSWRVRFSTSRISPIFSST